MAFVLARLRALDTAGVLGRTSSLFRAGLVAMSLQELAHQLLARRCSSRSSSLSLICRASLDERKALASAKTASAAAHGARLGGSMHGTPVRGTSNVRPWNPVVTAIAGLPPFPRHRTRTPRECPEGSAPVGEKTEGVRRRDEARLAAEKTPVRAGLLDVPPEMATGETHPRAKEPMNRAKNPLRRRAAPCSRATISLTPTSRRRDPTRAPRGQSRRCSNHWNVTRYGMEWVRTGRNHANRHITPVGTGRTR